MLGFLLALGTAVAEAAKDITSKFNLRHIDEYVAPFMMHLVETALLFVLVIILGFEAINEQFLWALLAATVLQFCALLLYFKAIKRSRISVAIPLITLTPLFMLVTSPIMVGQFPDTMGLIGILLIVAGTYISNLSVESDSIFAPFISLYKNEGSRYMLFVAIIWSFTANLDKIGIEATSPVFWGFTKDFVIMLYLIPVLAFKSSKARKQIGKRLWPLLAVGIFRFISVVTQFYALEFILVPFVIAIKRASTAFIILFAYFYLKEEINFRNRMTGIVIILAGLFLIALAAA